MKEKCCLPLGIILFLFVVSQSRVIVPRALPEDGPFGNRQMPFGINAFKKDNDFGLKPEIVDSPTVGDNFNVNDKDVGVNDPLGRPSDYDYNKPDRGVNELDNNFPGTEPERFPLGADRDERPEGKPIEEDEISKSSDEKFNKPLAEEDIDKSSNDDEDLEPSLEEEKPIHKDGDESNVGDSETDEFVDDSNEENKPEEEEKSGGERKDEEEKYKPEDEEVPDEERKDEEENDKPEDEEVPDEERKDEEEKDKTEDDDEHKYVPDEEPVDDEYKNELPKEVDEESVEDEEDHHDEAPEIGEAESFNGDSIFDNPFFNLERVKKYFGQLERALGHVFRQTLDEAYLLNGTYANTTEEEVDIDGKKYIVTKSMIKGSDNDSSLYVESLSSKPKINDTEA